MFFTKCIWYGSRIFSTLHQILKIVLIWEKGVFRLSGLAFVAEDDQIK